MPTDRVQQQLSHLKTLQAEGRSEAAVSVLRKALSDRVNVIAAKAASIADDWQMQELIPDLIKTFDRLLVKAAESDPQCWGKNAATKALKNLGVAESGLFLRGLQHHQLEAVWGGKVDTAGLLRATCALALVQCTDLPRREILVHLVNSLTESDARVRADAGRALEQMGGQEVTLLLRLKARLGDEEVRVTGQVLESLLDLEGAQAISFVAGFLEHKNEEVVEEAALALGSSRLPEAIELLQEHWLKSPDQHNAAALLRAISVSRQDTALAFLLSQVRHARLRNAEDALLALALHCDSEQIAARVVEAVSDREELRPLFRQKFQGS